MEEDGGGRRRLLFLRLFLFFFMGKEASCCTGRKRTRRDLVVGTEGPGAITGGRKEEKEGGIAPNFMAGSHGTTFSSLFLERVQF